ncbi:flagellin [Romboutsia maritimum]|uniref:Flagellin n=1 Tax=Romboutsia maritimum TaxID=2020948 RepID=A0A371IVI6_9FIRM|nr:flagellin [Romboutsia maritimum]RDY24507.1 flagellin [Romboutsia maritimum]
MRVNTNMNAIMAHNNMTKNTALAGNSMEKLSSGLRITKAGDDAAGLAISEKMRSQIRGLEQAGRNVQDGISVVQTAEGAMEETGNILQRMRELSVQAANETNQTEDRTKIVTELTQLNEEITRIADSTEFNGKKLLDGSTPTMTIQVGANTGTGQSIEIKLDNIKSTMATTGVISTSISSLSAGTITAQTAAATSLLTKIDAALTSINTSRSELGAKQNRLEYAQSNLTTSNENLTAAESRIRDVDVAKEMLNLSKLNILSQAAQSMLGQAKQQPEGVLQLLR